MEQVRRAVMEDPALQRESSPFFRVKVCGVKALRGVGPQGEPALDLDPDWQYHGVQEVRDNVCMLSVWDPTEPLEEALKEGSYVAVYSAQAPAPRNPGAGSSTLRLNASSSTKVRVLGRRAPEPLLAYARFEPRRVEPSVRAVRRKLDAATAGPSVSRDFDCVARLVRCFQWEVAPRGQQQGKGRAGGGGGSGRRGSSSSSSDGDGPYVCTRFFLLDSSRCVLCVEKRDYGASAASSASSSLGAMGPGDVLLLTDLTFESYDVKTDTVMSRYTANSTMRRAAACRRSRALAYAQQPLTRLEAWLATADGGQVMAREEARINALLSEGDRPSQGVEFRGRLFGTLRLQAVRVDAEERVLTFELDEMGAGVRIVTCDTIQSLRVLAAAVWEALSEDRRVALANQLATVRSLCVEGVGQQGDWPGLSLGPELIVVATEVAFHSLDVLVQQVQGADDVYELIGCQQVVALGMDLFA
jgi:hypothetical protein